MLKYIIKIKNGEKNKRENGEKEKGKGKHMKESLLTVVK